jgi:hypothetical protein
MQGPAQGLMGDKELLACLQDTPESRNSYKLTHLLNIHDPYDYTTNARYCNGKVHVETVGCSRKYFSACYLYEFGRMVNPKAYAVSFIKTANTETGE